MSRKWQPEGNWDRTVAGLIHPSHSLVHDFHNVGLIKEVRNKMCICVMELWQTRLGVWVDLEAETFCDSNDICPFSFLSIVTKNCAVIQILLLVGTQTRSNTCLVSLTSDFSII